MVRGFSGGEFTTNCSSMPHQLRNVGTTLPKELTSACTIGFTTVGQRFTQIRFDDSTGTVTTSTMLMSQTRRLQVTTFQRKILKKFSVCTPVSLYEIWVCKTILSWQLSNKIWLKFLLQFILGVQISNKNVKESVLIRCKLLYLIMQNLVFFLKVFP